MNKGLLRGLGPPDDEQGPAVFFGPPGERGQILSAVGAGGDGTDDYFTIDNASAVLRLALTLTQRVIKDGSGHTLTLPAATDTLVGLATTDTLTNKTLLSPIVQPTTNGTVGLTLQGAVGQSVNILSVQDSTGGSTYLAVGSGGAVNVRTSVSGGVAALGVTNDSINGIGLIVATASGSTVDAVQFAPNALATCLAVDKNGHLCGRNTAPGVVAGTAAGTTPPTPTDTNATDQAGVILLGTGSGSPTAGQQAVVTFNRAYAVAPTVLCWAANDATSPLAPFAPSANVTTTGFQVWFHTAPGVSQAVGIYRVAYIVMGS